MVRAAERRVRNRRSARISNRRTVVKSYALNPMLLYRFLNTRYGIEALQTKSLKVGRLLELNDPLDCQPVLTNQPVHVGEDDGAFERRFFRELHENIGILCYST